VKRSERRAREASEKKSKRVNHLMTVTPTHGGFRRSDLDTVASSARRIFLPKAIVQGRSSSGAWHANINTQKNSKLTKLLISLFSFAVLVFAMTCDKGDAHEKFSKAASNMGGGLDLSIPESGRSSDERDSPSPGREEIRPTTYSNVMMQVARDDVRPEMENLQIASSLKRLIKRCWLSRANRRPAFRDILLNLESNVSSEISSSASNALLKKKAENEAEEKSKRAIIVRARSQVRKFNSPVVLMRCSDFLKLNVITPFEVLRDDSRLSKDALKR